MNVSKTFETANGTVKFEGELEQAEADMVIKIGLSVLLQTGALKISGQEEDEEIILND